MGKKHRKKREPSQQNGNRNASDAAREGAQCAPHELPQFRRVLLVMLGLVAVTLFIYYQVRHFEFTGWDDPLYVVQNAEVSRGLTWHGVQWAFTTGHAANWHPLTWLSLMLDVQLFGVSPGSIHFTSVLLHMLNSLLLFWVLYRMTFAWGLSAFVAGLFAAHPLHVESVAWVAERKDVLSACFLLLTLWGYLAYVRRTAIKRYFLVLLLFVLALMAKPMAVTLPALLLVFDFWPLKRATLKRGQGRKWLQLIREKLPLAIVAVIASVVTLVVQHHGKAMASSEVFPFGARVSNACVSCAMYLIQMLWPGNLSPFYPFHPWPIWAISCSILGLAGISFLAFRNAESHPYFIAGWSWYLVTLLPVIGLIQVGDQSRADRYTYVPLIGIFIAIAWGASAKVPRRRIFETALPVVGCAIIGGLALPAASQAGYWRNSLVLWEHALATTAGNVHANVNYGFALMDKGDVSGAIAHYKEALRIDPNFAEAHNALGVALLRQNQVMEASRHFQLALRIKPDFADAQGNMGIVLMRQGRHEKAVSYFKQALAAKPEDAKLHLDFGLALAEMGEQDEASGHFSEAIRINPDFVEPRIQLGNILLMQGDADKAMGCYREAIRIKPDSADAHTNLGVGLIGRGRLQEAALECGEALRLNSESPEAHLCMGNVFARTGRDSEAVDQFEQAIRIKPAYAEAHNNLATLLINKMRDKEALVHLSEAIKARPDYVEALDNMAIALINTGHAREALPYLQKVLRLQPDNPGARENLKTALARQKQEKPR
jgi:tetratricopeptide (TPR) repeat protein